MTKRNLITVGLWTAYGLCIALGMMTHAWPFIFAVGVLGLWAALRTLEAA